MVYFANKWRNSRCSVHGIVVAELVLYGTVTIGSVNRGGLKFKVKTEKKEMTGVG